MTRLDIMWSLSWRIEISNEGYTTHTLLDSDGRRWGWVINASNSGWTAHLGSFSSNPCPIDELIALAQKHGVRAIETADTAKEGRRWVEEAIARIWKAAKQADAGRDQ